MNVIQKIVVPRTNTTYQYILTELEEMAREEFHRLKKVQEKKRRDREKREKKNEPKAEEITEENITCTTQTCAESILDSLKFFLTDLLTSASRFIKADKENIDLDKLLEVFKEATFKLDEFLSENTCFQPGQNTHERLGYLRLDLSDIIDITKQLKDKNQRVTEKNITDVLNKITVNIDDLLKYLDEYGIQILLLPNLEGYMQASNLPDRDNINVGDEKLIEQLKKGNKAITCNKKSQIPTKKTKEFTMACKEFKEKLENLQSKEPSEDIFKNLIEHIDEGIKLGEDAKLKYLQPESINELINTLKLFKDWIKDNVDKNADIPGSANNLGSIVEKMINIMSKVMPEGIAAGKEGKVTYANTLKEFNDCALCNFCKSIKKETYSEPEPEIKDICKDCPYAEASAIEDMTDAICKFCNKRIEAGDIVTNILKNKKQNLRPSAHVDNRESDSYEKITNIPKRKEESPPPPYYEKLTDVPKRKKENPLRQPVDNKDSAYYEKISRKEVKLTRTQKKDGTVLEEKETVVFKSEKRTPNSADLCCNDDDTCTHLSLSIDDDQHQVAVCTISNCNIRDVIGNTKSDIVVKTLPISDPVIRHCISLDTLNSCNLRDYYSTSSSVTIEDVFYTQ